MFLKGKRNKYRHCLAHLQFVLIRRNVIIPYCHGFLYSQGLGSNMSECPKWFEGHSTKDCTLVNIPSFLWILLARSMFFIMQRFQIRSVLCLLMLWFFLVQQFQIWSVLCLLCFNFHCAIISLMKIDLEAC